jgi:N-acetylmuramoyl-L-alanine amidase
LNLRYEDSLKFAEKVSSEFVKTFGNELSCLQTIQEQGYMLRYSPFIPAIFAEIGFITNLENVLLLYDEQGLEKCSVALANGITAYLASL